MSKVHIRRAGPLDAISMVRLLNQIIATGGTTAMTEPVAPEEITGWTTAPDAAWHVAETAGQIVGFQWIEPHEDLPREATNIATFVQEGRTGLGIGSALFTATAQVARNMGYAWINANIRADNDSGLTYYQSRGFRDWHRIACYRLRSGQVVDIVRKRYDLD